MGAAYFYHLTNSTLEATLPALLTKAMGAGWRVAVRGIDTAHLERLDAALWAGPGFLPHGLAGGVHDAEQPVLLTTGAAGNDPQCVMCVAGAAVTAQEVTAMERVCILFDGHDEAALTQARGLWKTLTGAGVSAQYWSQESGSWEKKVET